MKDRDYAWSPLTNQLESQSQDTEEGEAFQSPTFRMTPKGRFPPWVTLNRNLRLVVLVLFIMVIYAVFYTLSNVKPYENGPTVMGQVPAPSADFPKGEIGRGHGRPSDFAIPELPETWYEERCFAGGRQLGQSIGDVYEKLELMKGSSVPECLLIWNIFDRMFRFDLINAPIVLPLDFQTEVKGWLGNDPQLYYMVNHQKVYKIVNKYSFEESVFNPLRSKRPTSKSSVNPLDYITNLTLSTKDTCDFCSYKDHTAADTFGRIENKYSASASNTFKLAKFHGLFFPKTHNPIDLSYEVIADLFVNTSQQWFLEAHKSDEAQRYPSLLWDTLPHAGASQVHPHVHGILDSHQYAGSFEKIHDISQQYFKSYQRSYWTDLILVHWALGLGVSFGKAVAIVPLFARKDHEYMIFSPVVDEDFAKLIYRILEGYKKNLGVYCFSSGGAYPLMGLPVRDIDRFVQPGLPAVFRFGSRGVCTAIASDVSSLELYTVNNINSDISKTFKALKDSLQEEKKERAKS